MYEFHISVHRLPAGDVTRQQFELAAGLFDVLCLEPQQVTEPMAVRFEEACTALADLPQMFVEPDGSFVWTSEPSDEPWQVDGVVYDRQDRLLFVELKGTCPGKQFDQFLRAFGWPTTPLVFQLSPEAMYLAESEFRRFAESC